MNRVPHPHGNSPESEQDHSAPPDSTSSGRRVVCLWLPDWPIQRRSQLSPALRHQPLILVTSHRGREVVGHCCDQAAQRGIRPGMPLAEARGLLQSRFGRTEVGTWLPEEPEQDRQGLRQLAWDCDRFSPLVGLEEAETPESLMLEVTGCAPHFGGEQGLVREIFQFCQQRGLPARIGLADTFGAAWAIAHWGPRSQATHMIPPGEQKSVLRRYPVSALRLPPKTLERLHQVGLRTIGSLQTLPRSELPARFGPELLTRLDQALGNLPEPIAVERRPEPVEACWESDYPVEEVAILEQIAESLLHQLCAHLQPLGLGIKRLLWRLRENEGGVQSRTLELVQPSLQVKHLLSLMALQWEQLSLRSGVRQVHLCADRMEFLTARRQTLWDDETGRSSAAVSRLLETLTSRLGRDAVLRPFLRAEDQPERAFGLSPVMHDLPKVVHQEPPLPPGGRYTRPLWLKREPVAVEVIARHPQGAPVRFRWQQRDWNVHQAWGPERLTTGWWRGPFVRRDYVQVECDQGQRFWLFRDLVTGMWFLHAAFD